MTTFESGAAVRRSTAPVQSVDIAGTPWPLYKLQALVIGLVVFAVVLAATAVMQTAVLTAAAGTVIAWWGLRLAEQRGPSRH